MTQESYRLMCMCEENSIDTIGYQNGGYALIIF